MRSNLQRKNYKYWSQKEISLLREFYPKTRVKYLSKIFPNRTKATIVVKALNLNLPSAKLWQAHENDILRKHFAKAPMEKLLGLLPKRSYLAILARGERLSLRRNIKGPKLKVNENYFKKWSSNMAYILGFISADGNIAKITHNGCSDRLSFGQNKKDIDILRKIKQELSAEQTLSIGKKYVHFSVYSQIIVDNLKELGVSYRKSFRKSPGKIPNIPQKYIRDFIRGIVDGDGSIHFDKRKYPTLSICGRKEVMTFIRNHFLSKFDIYSKVSKSKEKNNLFYIAYKCNSAKTLINYLYKNANLYLERKFKLAKECSQIEMKYRKNYNEDEKNGHQETLSFITKKQNSATFASTKLARYSTKSTST